MNQSKALLYEHPLKGVQILAKENGIAALYCRLSNDDGRDGESYSISNQKQLLKQRAKELGFDKVKIYVDDGITGTTFQRQGFLEMKADIEKGLINAVIVKDLSRFGRNNSEILFYVETFFPENGIRFISLGESIDSITGNIDVLPFLSMFAEHYAKDISRKVRAVKYMKGNSGEPLGLPPYGYKRKSKDENKWVIDDEAADNVRRIFSMYISGYGIYRIAKALTADKVLTPKYYWQSKGVGRGGRSRKDASPYAWGSNTISKILGNQAYVGDLINFQTYKISFKSKKTVNVPKEHQRVFENVHEPIVSREDFEKIQQKRKRHSRNKVQQQGEYNMFSGVLFCADCGCRLHQHRYRSNGDEFFSCSNYKGNSTKGTCLTTHHIRFDYLYQVVLFEITKLIYFSKVYTDDFLRIVMDSALKQMEREGRNRQKELEKLLQRERELDAMFERIYEDEVLGKISQERFVKLSQKYEAEQAELTQKIRLLKAELSKEEDHIGTADEFISIMKRYQNLQELTPEIVKAFVKRIDVWDAQKQAGGERVQRLRITYNCIGNVTLPEHKDMPKPQIKVDIRQGVTATYSNYFTA